MGARLAGELGLPAGVATALAVAYARWDGRGVPAGVAGDEIPLSVRISIVARDLEIWSRETSNDATRHVLERRRGRAYDPTVVGAALGIGLDNLRRCEDDLWEVVMELEPLPHMSVSGPELLRALGALGDHADLKMPERSGYSRRVTRVASAAADIANFDSDDTQTLVQAALVHDVGVVAVPVRAWRARARPGTAEWEQVRLHPHWSARVLARCSGLEKVAAVAGQHHERLDGSGYPSALSGDLGRISGLLACAVAFDEITSTSLVPGAKQEWTEAATELTGLAGAGLDRRDVKAVLSAVGAKAPLVEMRRPAGLTEREVDVLSQLARGGTNRQIADTLGISAKTVGAHIEHIYTKIGVRSRAAAAVFAMQHELVG